MIVFEKSAMSLETTLSGLAGTVDEGIDLGGSARISR